MPKAFPVVASGFVHLRKELGRHQYHDLRCRYTYERLCEVVRTRREGGVNRESVTKTITHMLRCDKRPLSTENRELATKLLSLVESDIAFEPIEELELTNGTDGYVYDISIPGLERFIGGRSGLLLHNSAGAAHLRELTTPTAKWLGVWASDIIKYKLPSDPLTEIDIKRLYELKADPRYTEKMWHNELDTFLKIKKKSEQEAFSRYGLSYIVDKYLPEKLETMKSM
jgi:hypothetical protein